MKKILVVMGSSREGRAGEKVTKFVVDELKALGAEPTVADLKEINMPFFNNPLPPASEEFSTSEPSVLAWSKMVTESEAVLFVTPEYNHGLPAVLKNAVDWLGAEWIGKPVAIIGYGWSGATFAIADLSESMRHLKAVVHEDSASLFFMKSIGVDGAPIDDAAKVMVDPLLTELVG